ncbi:MAG: alpha/beta hydrolase [Bacteroidia bacterium]|nr:alpha/beta hydrolase [Bacteroidia bacterium]
MKTTKNILIPGQNKKPILADIYYLEDYRPKPIILFCHGYKGFKDWGAWSLMAEAFAKQGFCFIKFNFAFNGGTIEEPIDFPDLEAFGNNNYTKEIDDLDSVLNWIEANLSSDNNIDTSNITLFGHSRGGGIVTIKAEEDSRISNLISLAGVCDFEKRFPKGEALDTWKKEGVYYIVNGRTKQNMPHFFQFFEDFENNKERLSIKRAASNLKITHLIVHGSNDTSVSVEEARNLHKWNPNSELIIIEGADHVFNTKHPWDKKELSKELNEVVQQVARLLLRRIDY